MNKKSKKSNKKIIKYSVLLFVLKFNSMINNNKIPLSSFKFNN